MRMLVCTEIVGGGPNLPAQIGEDGPTIMEYIDGVPRDGSGYSGVGHIPQAATRLDVLDSSEAYCDAVIDGGYVVWWEVLDG